MTIYHSRRAPSRIDFFSQIQKELFVFAVKGLDFAQTLITTAQQALDHGIITAMNSAPEVQNVMPTPDAGDSEEQFIGRFMASSAMQKEYRDHRQRAAVAYKQWGENSAKNAREDQNIRTAEFKIPVIYADVISYKPGELGNSTAIGREGAEVYYTPEALKDAEYLATVESSLISVGTHEKNTSENNKSPDGFVRRAYWDENEKRVVMDAMAVGDREVTYIERNKARPGFGASAFLKFLELRRAEGVAPSGKKYNAIATKLVNDHVAIMDSVRDPRNMVIAMNATEHVPVAEEAAKHVKTKNSKVKNGGTMGDEAKETPVSKEAIRNTLEEMKAEDARNEESKKTKDGLDSLNARMAKIEESLGGKNADGKKPGEPDGDEGKNGDPKDKDGEEAANAKNALPAEEVVADIADYLGMKFDKSPTFNQLGSLLGVKGKSFSETVTAVNAKRKEIVSERKKSTGTGSGAIASNATGAVDFRSALNDM